MYVLYCFVKIFPWICSCDFDKRRKEFYYKVLQLFNDFLMENETNDHFVNRYFKLRNIPILENHKLMECTIGN